MFSHAPDEYTCPFWSIVDQCRQGTAEREQHGVIYMDELVTALVPTHHFAGIRGNVLVIPNRHYENIFDIDCSLGSALLRAIQRTAFAMKKAYHCEGVSTRQHNEPAGYQDVWHYHVHVFPRHAGDNLYAGHRARYAPEERLHHAGLLRECLVECE